MLSEIAHATLSKPPSYAEIILLDEQIRGVCRRLPEESLPAALPPLTGGTPFHSRLLTLVAHSPA
jgi:hypothetical protein